MVALMRVACISINGPAGARSQQKRGSGVRGGGGHRAKLS